MGWTTCFTAKHYSWKNGQMIVNRKLCVDDLFTWDSKDKDGNILKSFRVLKSAMVGSVWYGAIQIEDKETGSDKVTAGICLTCGRSKHDGTIWGYKDMDESMGPFYYKCPASILDLLTPTTDSSALLWREKCRETIKQEKATKKLAIPYGITCTYRGGWTISSPDYCRHYAYSGVRYHRSYSKTAALSRFIESYGTDAQKKAWAKTGAAA